MHGLKTVLMMLGALAVLMLGAVPASAMQGEAMTPACHDMGTADRVPASKPVKAMAAMACCVACTAVPALQPPLRGAISHPAAPGRPAPAALPAGRSPSPEPGPPRP